MVDNPLVMESTATSVNSWMSSSWLGNFHKTGGPWIFHEKLGWQYLHKLSTGGYWFWDKEDSFWWWSNTEIFPYAFDNSSNSWIFSVSIALKLESIILTVKYGETNDVWAFHCLAFLDTWFNGVIFWTEHPSRPFHCFGLTFTNLKIGQYFSVTGRVQRTGDAIPSGQTITAFVQFVAPDGIVTFEHEQSWNGFPEPGNSGTLRNTFNNQVLIQFPWDQASKDTFGLDYQGLCNWGGP